MERLQGEVQDLLDQRRELLNWQPYLVALREVERRYRGGTMLPACPHCGRGILAEELAQASISRQQEMEWRKFEQG